MQLVTLQFPNVTLLWSFAKTLKVQDFRIKGLQLICQGDQAMIEEALSFYKARLIQDQIKTD